MVANDRGMDGRAALRGSRAEHRGMLAGDAVTTIRGGAGLAWGGNGGVTPASLGLGEPGLNMVIGLLGRVMECRDPYTAGHQNQVADLSRRIARHLNLSVAECEIIGLGAEVHDVGKIAIPCEILARPGCLSAVEFDLIKAHPRVGYEILVGLDLPWQITDIVLHHHERLDGSGYPDRLAGAAISHAAMIVAVADVIDAMTSHRPYRAALGIDAARAEIQRGRGTLCDPAVSDAALAVTGTRSQDRPPIATP